MSEATQERKPQLTFQIIRALVLVGILGFGAWATIDNWVDKDDLIASLEAIEDAPNAWAVFAFIFAAFSCVALPVTPLMLASGCLFGFALGALFNWIGSCIAAWAAYGVARWLGADTLEALFRRQIARFRKAGFRTTLFLRLILIFPFAGVNFGAGAARVPFREYSLATAIGMVPSSISFTLFAASGVDSLREPSLEHLAVFALSIALLLLGAVAPIYYKRRIRRADTRTDRGRPHAPEPGAD